MTDEVLTRFAHLIRDHRVLTDRHDNRVSEYKARLGLANGSILEFSDVLHVIDRQLTAS